jgi:hypothetical protein
MEHCVFCQAPLAPGEYVCQHCGRMQPLAQLDQPTITGANLGTLEAAPCPRCGTLASATDPYCRNCGLPLNALGDQATRKATDPLPAPAPWTPAAEGQPVAPAYPGSGPTWNQGGQPGSGPGWGHEIIPMPPPPPAWAQGPLPYQPDIADPQGSLPTLSGPPPAWQPGGTPFQPGSGPGRFTTPPPAISKPTPAPRPSRRLVLITALVLVALLVLGGGGAAAYLLTRPTPTLSVTGPTQSGSNPAGAPDTKLHVVGTGFTARSLITFFLDGKSLQGAPVVQTDGSGSFTADLPITDDWLLGQHTLSAKDGKDNGPKNAVTIVVLAAPVLTVTSQYQQSDTPAGSAGTTFTITGKRFALSSPVTLLLDGKPLAGQTPITSDDHGRVQAEILVGKDWAKGTHTFSARDTQGNATQGSAAVVVVAQGVAGTPGPKGAPADNASFDLGVSVTAKDSAGDDVSFQQFLIITGQPDPAGGKVCSAQDDGQPHTFDGTLSGGLTFKETIVFSCKGAYKSGHLTYTETATSDQIVVSDGSVCTAQGAYIYGQFDGTFNDASTITGTYHRNYFNAPCRSNRFSSLFRNTAQGTWTGGK